MSKTPGGKCASSEASEMFREAFVATVAIIIALVNE